MEFSIVYGVLLLTVLIVVGGWLLMRRVIMPWLKRKVDDLDLGH